MVSYDDDVDAAMKVHLLQTVHQLTDDVIDLPQRVIELQTGREQDGELSDAAGFPTDSFIRRRMCCKFDKIKHVCVFSLLCEY